MPIFLQLQCLLPVSAIQVRLLIKKVCCTIQDIHHCNSKRQIIFLLSPIIYEEAAKTPNDLLLTKIAQKQNNFPKKRPQGRYLPQELSMTKKMDWLQFDDTLNDVFQILLSNFYSGNQDKELNLKLLNPSYFKEIHNLKTKKSINPYTNTSYLRNCYIDLIRYDRLT